MKTKLIPSFFLSFAAILILTTGISWAAARDLAVRAGLELRYDDNVFQYSNKDLNQFDNSKAKFRSLESEDDWTLIPSVDAGYRIRHRYDTRVSLGVDAKLYERNTVKNYQVYTARVRQELPGRFEIGLRYLLVPRFFLRPLANPPNQVTTYSDAKFRIHSLHLDLDKDFNKWLAGGASGLFEKKDYTADFNERDTTVVGGGAEARVRLNPAIRVAVGADYERGKARGRDDATINSDTSYAQQSYHVRPSAQLAKGITLGVGYSYDSRHYASDLAADKDHFHRNDFTNTWDFRLKGRMTKKLDAYLDHERIDRSSNTPEITAEFADFTERRTTAGVTYEF